MRFSAPIKAAPPSPKGRYLNDNGRPLAATDLSSVGEAGQAKSLDPPLEKLRMFEREEASRISYVQCWFLLKHTRQEPLGLF